MSRPNTDREVGARSIEQLDQLRKNALFQTLLAPAALAYGLINQVRAALYRNGLAASKQVSVPVVSIGNITVGGTGKTPIVIDLARRLTSRGLKVAILSRGYGRRSAAETVVVCAGHGPCLDVRDSGDEPYQTAQAVPEAVIIVGSNRITSAQLAIAQYGADIILLDDGFQHLRLRRNLDIVLFDYNDAIDGLRLLPQGQLREALPALARASIVLITKIPALSKNEQEVTNNTSRLTELKARLSLLAPGAVLCQSRFVAAHLVSLVSPEKAVDLQFLNGKKVFAFCAVARPESFYALIKDCALDLQDSLTFGDHHWFSEGDLKNLEERFVVSGADYLLTTEKDLVRLDLPPRLAERTMALALAPEWIGENGETTGAPPFIDSILKLIASPVGATPPC